MQLSDLAKAQDDLNATIKKALEAFCASNEGINVNYCNVHLTRDASGDAVANVFTAVEGEVDGARITRVMPKG